MSKRAVITGAAGFIGSHLTGYLLGEGWEVIAVDNLITGALTNLDTFASNKNFCFIKHDVTEFISIEGDVDYVFHLASPASPVDFVKFPIQTLKVGSLGTHNALGLAKEKGAKFLLTSTSEIYGDPLIHPQPETYWGNVNPIGIRGAYDEAKRFAEAITMAYHRMHGINIRIARLFNTYGPRMRSHDGRVIPNFITQALNNEPLTIYKPGTQTRSFGYVDDIVKGIFQLSQTDYNEPVNIGNPYEITMTELAREIISLANSSSDIILTEPTTPDDPLKRKPDISLAKQLFQWNPAVSLEDGLLKTIEYFSKK